jgi:hypothetical protein
LVESEPAKQQAGEQVGAALLFGSGGAGGPIDHQDLVRIQVAAVEGFPDSGQAPGESAVPASRQRT